MTVFERCRAADRAALIAYLMAGDPAPADTPELIRSAVRGGADMIELGIPFSDPLADGPSIQAAAQRALAAGTTFDKALKIGAQAKSDIGSVPLYALTYYNPLYVRGVARTAREFRNAGFSGAVIVDLPPDDAGGLAHAFARESLALVFLVAPTTPAERARHIAEACTDFVYVVSRMGVTGTRQGPGPDVAQLVQRLRPLTPKPLAVGFGVATPQDARAIGEAADGVIVGSALIDRIAAAASKRAAIESVGEFCRACSSVMRQRAKRRSQPPPISTR